MGVLLGLGLSGWCAYTATGFVGMMMGVGDRGALVGYPLYLYFVSFAMIAIF